MKKSLAHLPEYDQTRFVKRRLRVLFNHRDHKSIEESTGTCYEDVIINLGNSNL